MRLQVSTLLFALGSGELSSLSLRTVNAHVATAIGKSFAILAHGYVQPRPVSLVSFFWRKSKWQIVMATRQSIASPLAEVAFGSTSSLTKVNMGLTTLYRQVACIAMARRLSGVSRCVETTPFSLKRATLKRMTGSARLNEKPKKNENQIGGAMRRPGDRSLGVSWLPARACDFRSPSFPSLRTHIPWRYYGISRPVRRTTTHRVRVRSLSRNPLGAETKPVLLQDEKEGKITSRLSWQLRFNPSCIRLGSLPIALARNAPDPFKTCAQNQASFLREAGSSKP